VCKGDSGKGEAQQAVLRKRRCNRTRDWAGGRVLILGTLRPLVSEATVTLGWRSLLVGPGRRMRFEAFVTDQRKTPDTRHVKDAHLAIATFQRGMRDLATFQSSVEEPIRLSLLGAMISSHLLAGHPQIHGGDPSSTLDDLVSEEDHRQRNVFTPSRWNQSEQCVQQNAVAHFRRGEPSNFEPCADRSENARGAGGNSRQKVSMGGTVRLPASRLPTGAGLNHR